MSRQSALSSSHTMPPEFYEALCSRLPTLLHVGYSVKLKTKMYKQYSEYIYYELPATSFYVDFMV